MKKTVLFFLMIILIASCHQEEIPSVSKGGETMRVKVRSV